MFLLLRVQHGGEYISTMFGCGQAQGSIGYLA